MGEKARAGIVAAVLAGLTALGFTVAGIAGMGAASAQVTAVPGRDGPDDSSHSPSDDSSSASPSASSSPSASVTPTPQPAVQVTRKQARAIARERVAGEVEKVRLTVRDGRPAYAVRVDPGRARDRIVYVDAATGSVLAVIRRPSNDAASGQKLRGDGSVDDNSGSSGGGDDDRNAAGEKLRGDGTVDDD